MASFKNDYNITNIKMKRKLHNLCTIGQDWFTSNLEIEFIPNEIIPDYIEIDRDIQKYESKELIIEELVNNILQDLKQYKPNYIKVTSKVDDAMHLPVEVIAEYKN